MVEKQEQLTPEPRFFAKSRHAMSAMRREAGRAVIGINLKVRLVCSDTGAMRPLVLTSASWASLTKRICKRSWNALAGGLNATLATVGGPTRVGSSHQHGDL